MFGIKDKISGYFEKQAKLHTALFDAAANGRTEDIDPLIEDGAHPFFEFGGKNAAQVAEDAGHKETADKLREAQEHHMTVGMRSMPGC